MSVHRMQFVLVNNMAPRNPSVCAACSRPLDRGYLHRSFHLEALLRDRVLPAIGGGKRICRVDRSGDCIRTRCRLAEADR
jgi:hypothetical protein